MRISVQCWSFIKLRSQTQIHCNIKTLFRKFSVNSPNTPTTTKCTRISIWDAWTQVRRHYLNRRIVRYVCSNLTRPRELKIALKWPPRNWLVISSNQRLIQSATVKKCLIWVRSSIDAENNQTEHAKWDRCPISLWELVCLIVLISFHCNSKVYF